MVFFDGHWQVKEKPFLVIIVTSSVDHVELRNAHRMALPQDLLAHMSTVRVFLLAAISDAQSDSIVQEDIEVENKTFGDILQGSFLEHYRNLTCKNLMGLRWASSSCKNANFILKVDDDVVFNIYKTYATLFEWNIRLKKSQFSHEYIRSFLLGHLIFNKRPSRDVRSKLYVSPMEYLDDYFPLHLSGWYYITTPETAYRIAQVAICHTFFPIDDVFITGKISNSLNISLKQLYPPHCPSTAQTCVQYMIQNFVIPEYHVLGQNSGRINLIVEFYEALKNCDIWRNCTSSHKLVIC